MRSLYFAVFVVAAGMFVTGCGKNQYTEEINTLDSLKSQVVAAHAIFKTIDSTTLPEINKQVFEDLRQIQREYKPDSIDMDKAMLINTYKSLRKQSAKLLMVRSRLNKNFPYTEKQLGNLIYDLKEQSIKKAEADKYVQAEQLAFKSLMDAFELYNADVPKVIREFDSLRPIVKSFRESLVQPQ